MLQAFLKDGRVVAKEVPAPVVSPGSALIKTVYSCISAGTELAGLRTASNGSLIRQALQQPEKVAKAWQMLKDEGLAKTVARIRQAGASAARQPELGRPTGYSLAGVVAAVSEGVIDLRPGDRVAAAGAGIANHAEWVDVPRNLIMRIPQGLDLHAAATVTLGGIAMQGVRRAKLELGEFVVVHGTGVLGLIAVQLVRASGCRCIAVDLDDRRLEIARQLGAERTINPSRREPAEMIVSHLTGGHGADAVIFAAATENPSALAQAFGMTRKKGRVVMVGVYGNELNRNDIYPKEIDFLISTSYGPGRYDPVYEQQGLDYPYPYVRWTENRNMEEYLRLLSTGTVNVEPLIEAVYPIDKITEAFAALMAPQRPLTILLDYGAGSLPFEAAGAFPRKLPNPAAAPVKHHGLIRVALVGAGNFARNVHLPNLRKLSARYHLRAICSRTGPAAQGAAAAFGADYATTDYREVLDDPEVDLVMICTRHNLHGQMVIESLEAGKHTFVEKPLCTTNEELETIKAFYGIGMPCAGACLTNRAGQGLDTTDRGMSAPTPPWPNSLTAPKPILMVGFNRRFSKYAREIKRHVEKRINPLFIHYRMNAGYLPPDHWVHGDEGGGRIVGEACHILDLFSYITGSPVQAFSVASLRSKTESIGASDNKSITVEYEDGSVATLEYFSIGSQQLPKEWMEVHFDGMTLLLDDYRKLSSFSPNIAAISSPKPDKGHLETLESLAERISTFEWPIHLRDIIETTQLTLASR